MFQWVYQHNNPQLIDQLERAHRFGYYDINCNIVKGSNLIWLLFIYYYYIINV